MAIFTKVRPIDSRDLIDLEDGQRSCFHEGCTAFVTHAVSGEEDSFGIEWEYGCLAHCNESKENSDQPFEGCCSWCKNKRDSLMRHRDYEEGSNGPVYEVCLECRQKESAAIQKELAEDDSYASIEDFDDSINDSSYLIDQEEQLEWEQEFHK